MKKGTRTCTILYHGGRHDSRLQNVLLWRHVSKRDRGHAWHIKAKNLPHTLSLAKQRNIVEFLIDPSGGQRERMAEFLKAQYKLDDVLIAPSSPRPEQALDNLALLAGSYFGEAEKRYEYRHFIQYCRRRPDQAF